MSGIYLCSSINIPAVMLIQAVKRTGAVDKYLSKFLSILVLFFIFIKN